MKTFSYTLIALAITLISSDLSAQTLPKTGAALKANTNTLEISQDQPVTVDITRLRSRSYQKAKFGAIKVNTPDGLTATVAVDESNADLYTVTIDAAPSIASGTYTVTIQGEGRNASKVKATMLTIKLDDSKLAKSN